MTEGPDESDDGTGLPWGAITTPALLLMTSISMGIALTFNDAMSYKYVHVRPDDVDTAPKSLDMRIGYFSSHVRIDGLNVPGTSTDNLTCGMGWAVSVAAAGHVLALVSCVVILICTSVDLAKKRRVPSLKVTCVASMAIALVSTFLANVCLGVALGTANTRECPSDTWPEFDGYDLGWTWIVGLIIGGVALAGGAASYLGAWQDARRWPAEDRRADEQVYPPPPPSAPAVKIDTGVPPYWLTGTDRRGDGGARFELADDMWRRRFQDLLDATCRTSALGSGRDQVSRHGKYDRLLFHRAWRVENAALFKLYATHRDHQIRRPPEHVLRPVTHTADSGVFIAELGLRTLERNEVLLWHGTRPEDVDSIADEGFDERVGRLSGLFGAGIYFAEEVSKSDQYVTPVPADDQRDGVYTVLLVRVAMGTQHWTSSRTKKARRAPPGCDSLVGECGANRYKEYVVYDGWQAYPEFIVQYKRRYIETFSDVD